MDQTGEEEQGAGSRECRRLADLLAVRLPSTRHALGARAGGAAAQGGMRPDNRRLRARIGLSPFAVCALATMVTTAAYAQAPAPSATPAELEQQVTVLREQLRTVQEQQKGLIETLNRLQQQLASQPVPTAPQSVPLPPAAAAPAPQVAVATPPVAREAEGSITQQLAERYQDGIVIWQTPDDAKVPFLLRYNINSQVRYLNTTSGDDTFTDHLGVVRERQSAQRHHGQPHDVHPGRLHLRSAAALQHHRVDVRGVELDRHRGEHRLAIQQGLHADGWLHGRPRQPVAREDVPVLPVDRPHHGGQLLPPRLHAGNLGQRGHQRS